jgi:cystathionine gamma-lyase
MGVTDRSKIADAPLMERGEVGKAGKPVPRGFPKVVVLDSPPASVQQSGRLELARWLEQQPQVERVHYPGLESHPQHELAKRQMSGGFGGMISVTLKTDLSGARRFLEAVRIFALAESLGGVESLIEHPAIMTHATIPAETRAKLGIGDGLVRLSVGVEGIEDLREDLRQALARI